MLVQWYSNGIVTLYLYKLEYQKYNLKLIIYYISK